MTCGFRQQFLGSNCQCVTCHRRHLRPREVEKKWAPMMVSQTRPTPSKLLQVACGGSCDLWYLPPAILGAELLACNLSSPSPEA